MANSQSFPQIPNNLFDEKIHQANIEFLDDYEFFYEFTDALRPGQEHPIITCFCDECIDRCVDNHIDKYNIFTKNFHSQCKFLSKIVIERIQSFNYSRNSTTLEELIELAKFDFMRVIDCIRVNDQYWDLNNDDTAEEFVKQAEKSMFYISMLVLDLVDIYFYQYIHNSESELENLLKCELNEETNMFDNTMFNSLCFGLLANSLFASAGEMYPYPQVRAMRIFTHSQISRFKSDMVNWLTHHFNQAVLCTNNMDNHFTNIGNFNAIITMLRVVSQYYHNDNSFTNSLSNYVVLSHIIERFGTSEIPQEYYDIFNKVHNDMEYALDEHIQDILEYASQRANMANIKLQRINNEQ